MLQLSAIDVGRKSKETGIVQMQLNDSRWNKLQAVMIIYKKIVVLKR